MNGSESAQQELPFTKVPNIFLDEWVNILGLVEIRIVAAILRRTFGWHRKDSGPLSVTELSEITRRSRPLVVKALARLRGFGIVNGSRLSRQEPLAYGLIMQPEFKALKEVPPPAKQTVLPYDVHHFSSKENLTTETASVVKETLPLSGKENLTTEAPVLRSIKESRSKETHTHAVREAAPVENIAARQRVCGSKFEKPLIRKYAYASRDFDHMVNAYWEARGKKQNYVIPIRSPEAFATAALHSGEHDEEIQEWIDDPDIFNFELFRQINRASNY
jgi:hypothetical protein